MAIQRWVASKNGIEQGKNALIHKSAGGMPGERQTKTVKITVSEYASIKSRLSTNRLKS